MNDKPNEPGADFDSDGKDQAMDNQSTVTADDYPDTGKGRLSESDRTGNPAKVE